MIFSPLPDEYIASAIRRGNELLGINGINRQDYSIRSNPKPVGISKSRKVGFKFPVHFTDNNIAMRVLYENTLYPLAAAMSKSGSKCQYTPHVNFRICLQCVIEDINDVGTAFLHRSHQLSSVRLCSKHATSLHTECPTCKTSITTHKIYELSKCSESYEQETPRYGSNPHKYAIFIRDILNFRRKPLRRYWVFTIIEHKLKKWLEQDDSRDEATMEALIAERTETNIILLDWYKSLNKVCLLSFMFYSTAEEYFKGKHPTASHKYY